MTVELFHKRRCNAVFSNLSLLSFFAHFFVTDDALSELPGMTVSTQNTDGRQTRNSIW